MRAAFASLGLSCRTEQAITGLTADVRGRSDEATIALMGELDAILLPDYPYADKATGAAHVCGHQCAAGRAVRRGDWACEQRRNAGAGRNGAAHGGSCRGGHQHKRPRSADSGGKIKTFNGKQEFIRLGLFDGVSAALMQHTSQGDKVSAGGAGGLCVVPKLMRYRGRSAHPVNAHIGVNALTAGANRSGRGRPRGTPIA